MTHDDEVALGKDFECDCLNQFQGPLSSWDWGELP
jgi:hypothetical protein